jgi:DNA mismatch repair protein MutL
MSIIKLLPENLINQIAAGEVVERPSSVVKELVENSLDAGANNIVVEVVNGGISSIKITDNGKGMSREDLELAVRRHATSKILNESDLWDISTMGFRGEALASISSVSKMTIKSKRSDDLGGTQLDCVSGEIKTIKDVGMSDGTVVEVYDLFFNTPARQKYLKRESTEFGHISSLLNTLSLANPSISFKLVHNGKTVNNFPKVDSLISRIADVFGKNTSDAMLEIFYGGSEVQVDGFIGKPLLSRSTGQHQYLFVNGRPIQHHLLFNRIKAAYHSMLMEHKKPVFVLNIKIDPSLIDVNVHPRKLEIRFEDQDTIIKIIYGCVKTALEKADLMPKGYSESKKYMSDSSFFGNNSAKSSFGGGFIPSQRPSFSSDQALDFSKQILQRREQQAMSNLSEKSHIRAISQVSNSYIVAENEEGLVLIDQHAAHERVRYEELMDQFESQKKSVQPLLVPQQIELSSDEIILLEEKKDVFEDLGFEIEEFGGNTFSVTAVPSCLSKQNLDEVIKEVLDDIKENKDPNNTRSKVEEILTYMACRSAIKFGQKLTLDEMQALILQTEKLKRPYTCPHGRPTMISLSLGELEKMFGRK